MFATVIFLFSFLAISYGRGIGNSIISPRIVNGENATLGELPFQVSLQFTNNEHFCGGSVVNRWYVLTAAHCMDEIRGHKLEPKDIMIAAGSVKLSEPYDVHRVAAIKIHEKYYAKGLINDIAVLRVERPFELLNTNRIKPVQLPAPREIVPTNTSVVVSGWGHLVSEERNIPDNLQKARILVADQEYCRIMNYEKHYAVLSTNICANDPTVRRGQCSGDSGGPLTIGQKIVGIVSQSVKDPRPLCASTKYPGIYTRVSEYIDWIVDNTKEDEWIWN